MTKCTRKKYNTKEFDKIWKGVDRPQYLTPPPVRHTETQILLFQTYESLHVPAKKNLKSWFESSFSSKNPRETF